jgi:hypothetical protein
VPVRLVTKFDIEGIFWDVRGGRGGPLFRVPVLFPPGGFRAVFGDSAVVEEAGQVVEVIDS